MIGASLIRLVGAGAILMLLAALLRVYQHPLFEVYLSSWGIC